MLIWVQVCYSHQEIRRDGWVPWRNCKSRDEAVMLAAHKFVRESRPRDGQEFVVCSYPDELEAAARHADGSPKQCLMTVMRANVTQPDEYPRAFVD